MGQVELFVRQAGHPERRYLISSSTTTLGRAEDNDVVLSDLGVSRKHARIVIDGDSIRIDDLGSGNGTWFDGSEIESQGIVDGTEVQIDPFVLLFRIRESPSERGSEVDEDRTLRSKKPLPQSQIESRLVVLSGHRLASSYVISEKGLTLGRSESRDVVLFDPGASRNHVHIELRPGSYWLVDHGSANGTYLNGKRVKEHPLMPGDHIRIGATEFRVEIPEEVAKRMHRKVPATLPDSGENAESPTSERWVSRMGARLPSFDFPSWRKIALVAVVFLSILVVWKTIGGSGSDRTRSRTEDSTEEVVVLAALEHIRVADLPESEADRFALASLHREEGDHYLAARHFDAVLETGARFDPVQEDAPIPDEDESNATDDAMDSAVPDAAEDSATESEVSRPHGVAPWMAETSREAHVLEILLAELNRETEDESTRRAIGREANELSRRAIAGWSVDDVENSSCAGCSEARTAIQNARRHGLSLDAVGLAEHKARLDAALEAEIASGRNRGERVRLGDRVVEAEAFLTAGDYRRALEIYESILVEDEGRTTPAHFQAIEGIRRSTERLHLATSAAGHRYETAMEAGDEASAAEALRLRLNHDYTDEEAATLLAELDVEDP